MKLGLNKHIRIYSDGSVYHMGLSDPTDIYSKDGFLDYLDYVEYIQDQNKATLKNAINKFRAIK